LLGAVATTVAVGVIVAALTTLWRSSSTWPFMRTRTIEITPPPELPAGADFEYMLLRVCLGEAAGRRIGWRPIRRFKPGADGTLFVTLRASQRDGLQFKCFIDVHRTPRPGLEDYERWMAPSGWVNPRFDRDLKDARVWFLLPDEDYRWRPRDTNENNYLHPATTLQTSAVSRWFH
jgi:hypothetical protein